MLRTGAAVAAAAVMGAAAYGIARIALTSRFLTVKQLVIGGNIRLSAGEIEALTHGLRGQNIFRIDLDQYRKRLLESPWLTDANMHRVLPSTIEIRVTERTPMAIARVDSRLYLVDDDGGVIDEYGPQYREFDLPVVDGLVQTGADGAPGARQAAARLTREFLDALQAAPSLRDHVSQFDVSNDHDLVALVDDDATAIHLGDSRFVDRLRRYYDLAPALRDRLADIEHVDMRFDERVYVRSRATAKRAKDTNIAHAKPSAPH